VDRAEAMARSLARQASPAVRAARRQTTPAANPALSAPWELAPSRVPAPAGYLSSASARTPRSTKSISILETAAILRATARPQPISAGAAEKGRSVTLVVGHWISLRSARPGTLAFALRRMVVLICAASGSSEFLEFRSEASGPCHDTQVSRSTAPKALPSKLTAAGKRCERVPPGRPTPSFDVGSNVPGVRLNKMWNSITGDSVN